MSFFEIGLLLIGGIIGSLIYAGLQRIFFPHTAVNGFMDVDKLKEMCPEVFEKEKTDKKDAVK